MPTPDATMHTEHDDFAPMEAWDAIASGYDEYVAPGEAGFAAAALRLVGLRPGERLLDVAAGPGGLSLPAARLGARVLATDWSPSMVARFAARADAEGLAGVEGRVMDAHALELDDDSFDVTASQFGVMLVPDQAAALREMVRVTRPGGRVLLVAYGPPEEFEALQFFVAALQSVVADFEGLPDDPPPLEFQVSEPRVLHQRLTEAGLREVHVDTSLREVVRFATGEECWRWMLNSNPVVGMILADVTEGDQAAVREVLHGMVRERAGSSPSAALTAALNVGIGWKQPS
jgi:ubiquinone/menaquinone biosynthesis C-methylase UbiE